MRKKIIIFLVLVLLSFALFFGGRFYYRQDVPRVLKNDIHEILLEDTEWVCDETTCVYMIDGLYIQHLIGSDGFLIQSSEVHMPSAGFMYFYTDNLLVTNESYPSQLCTISLLNNIKCEDKYADETNRIDNSKYIVEAIRIVDRALNKYKK